MSKRQKRLQKIQQNPKDVSFEELENLLRDYGFILDRSSGSHHTFKLMLRGEWQVLVIPYKKPVKPIYVKEALRLIKEVELEVQKNEDVADDE